MSKISDLIMQDIGDLYDHYSKLIDKYCVFDTRKFEQYLHSNSKNVRKAANEALYFIRNIRTKTYNLYGYLNRTVNNFIPILSGAFKNIELFSSLSKQYKFIGAIKGFMYGTGLKIKELRELVKETIGNVKKMRVEFLRNHNINENNLYIYNELNGTNYSNFYDIIDSMDSSKDKKYEQNRLLQVLRVDDEEGLNKIDYVITRLLCLKNKIDSINNQNSYNMTLCNEAGKKIAKQMENHKTTHDGVILRNTFNRLEYFIRGLNEVQTILILSICNANSLIHFDVYNHEDFIYDAKSLLNKWKDRLNGFVNYLGGDKRGSRV